MNKTIKLYSEEPAENLSRVLTRLMEESNLRASQLSRNTGLAYATITRMMNEPDCNPTLSSLQKIADFFGVSSEQLLGKEPLHKHIHGYRPDVDKWINVPVLTLREAIGWPGEPGNIDDHDRPHIKTDLNVSEHVFAVIGEGESLEPRFSEGTVLILDPEREPKNKDYALLLMEGKTLPQFRQLFMDGSDIYARTINPNLAENTPFLLSNKTKILGILIQAKSTFISD